jgi:hypothetical protein
MIRPVIVPEDETKMVVGKPKVVVDGDTSGPVDDHWIGHTHLSDERTGGTCGVIRIDPEELDSVALVPVRLFEERRFGAARDAP